jgi:RimJ/RimL family protein N-acetyltransferase
MVDKSQLPVAVAASSGIGEGGARERGELVRLADGGTVHVRPLERTDREDLDAAVAGLSDRSRYLRFATAKPRLSARELDRLTDVDHRRHEALLGIDPVTGHGIAVARYIELEEAPGVVEVAVTVNDAWQGRGLGTLLLHRILVRAREEGHGSARAEVLSENTRSRAMLRRAGFTVLARAGLMIEMHRRLDGPVAASR